MLFYKCSHPGLGCVQLWTGADVWLTVDVDILASLPSRYLCICVFIIHLPVTVQEYYLVANQDLNSMIYQMYQFLPVTSSNEKLLINSSSTNESVMHEPISSPHCIFIGRTQGFYPSLSSYLDGILNYNFMNSDTTARLVC